ncbi:hypothetical protein D1B31_12310 [Neobacillus notoginsengisoli]|uniref:Uncharacterized protein n=1 Tax=Neobacillus notoginsengisoli TaxID=1578198 RepID=A0A417YTH0_9BACI|nr:hypothetical protein [Neobacillus notoginsengisoli]RHW40329.1 hypothetical protein D1B31_12310 [Neobacillus notoginsengisoli]
MKSSKKLFSTVLAFVVGLGIVSPVFAEQNFEALDSDIDEITNEFQEPNFIYHYNGIEFSGNEALTDRELSELYNNLMRDSTEIREEDEISLLGNDPGSSFVRVISPMYKTYSNRDVKYAAEIITIYLVSKAPSPIRTTALGTWILTKMSGWVNLITPSYVGAWTSSSYDNYTGQRRYYETLVHYKYSNYTTPLSVQYYDVTSWWK